MKYYGGILNIWFTDANNKETSEYFQNKMILDKDVIVVYKGEKKFLEIGIWNIKDDLGILFKKLLKQENEI